MSEDYPKVITSHCVWQLTRGQYLSLVGDYFSEHDGWGVERMIYTGAYPSYQWWIFGSDMIYTRAYPDHWWRFLSGWCFALRHIQFTSSLGLWWIGSCGMTLHWGIAISESAFIGDTITLLDTQHWDTLYSLMVDFRDDDLCWGIALSSMMDFDLSWSIVTSDGLYWGIASSFVLIELRDFDSYGLCWDVSIFSTRSRDWLICWLGYTTLHWGIARMESIFHWSIVTLFGFFTLGHAHLLEGDKIDSWRWNIWRVIWRSLDHFMLSSLHTEA